MCLGDLNSLEMVALDVHAAGPRALLLLVAAVNVARSPDMRYALGAYSLHCQQILDDSKDDCQLVS